LSNPSVFLIKFLFLFNALKVENCCQPPGQKQTEVTLRLTSHSQKRQAEQPEQNTQNSSAAGLPTLGKT
jgi:hypothetical protein